MIVLADVSGIPVLQVPGVNGPPAQERQGQGGRVGAYQDRATVSEGFDYAAHPRAQ